MTAALGFAILVESFVLIYFAARVFVERLSNWESFFWVCAAAALSKRLTQTGWAMLGLGP